MEPFFYSHNKTSFVNIKQAAKILGCSTRTIHRYIEKKKLRGIRPIHNQGVPYSFLIKDIFAFNLFGIDRFSKLTNPQKEEVKEYL